MTTLLSQITTLKEFFSSKLPFLLQSVELTPSVLGAVTALAWVATTLGDQESPQLEGAASSLVACISKLPADMKIRKPTDVQPPSLPDSENQKQIDWGPLISHSFISYWKCILYTLRKLYGDQPTSLEAEGSVESTKFSSSGGSTAVGMLVGCEDAVALAQVCLDTLDIAGQSLDIVIECLSLLVPKVCCVCMVYSGLDIASLKNLSVQNQLK